MKKVYLSIGLVCSFIAGYAQQDVMVSQYMFNGLFLNPGYAGSHKYVSSTLVYRNQWVGFDGSAKTGILAVDAPLKNETMGLGGVVSSDMIGQTRQTDVYGMYSYHLKMGGSDNGKLSFGLKGGFSQYNTALTKLTVWDGNDAVFSSDRQSAFLPKAGVGIYYYSTHYFGGISVPTLMAYDPKYDYTGSRIKKHYFVTGGYVYQVNDMVKIKPSFLLKYQKAAPFQYDINFGVLYNNTIWTSVSYRSGDAIVVMAEYQINPHLRLGYSVDFTTTQIRKYSSGTHEIMIGYDFGKNVGDNKPVRSF